MFRQPWTMGSSARGLAGAIAIVCGMVVAGPLGAQEGKYIWTGVAHPPHPSDSCSVYKMTINVTVQNGRVIGLFQQEGRQQRNFDVPLQANGTFKGEAKVANGTMAVTGKIAGDSSEILLHGYCRFGGKLRRA